MTTRRIFERSSRIAGIVVCWLAVLFGFITAANAAPYDNMVGCWAGKAHLYNPQGQLLGTTSSTGSVYWKVPNSVMHFQQSKGGGVLEYDLQVTGNNAIYRSVDTDVTGTETSPGSYFFLLNFKSGPQAGTWYNNHYFTTTKHRMVLGSFEPAFQAGQVGAIAVQSLGKVRCHFAPKKKRVRPH